MRSVVFSLSHWSHGPVDYLLMPLLGYIVIILSAQVAARVVTEQQ